MMNIFRMQSHDFTVLAKKRWEKGASKSPRFTLADVEQIYQAYPRHVGKAAAIHSIERALVRCLADHPDDAFAWLLGKVQEYAKTPAAHSGHFTPHPATWFNQDRFNDDPKEWSRRHEPADENKPLINCLTGEIMEESR